MTSTGPLASAIGRVVENGNCSGCGGCAALTSRVTMQLDARGFLRPQVATDGDRTRGEQQLTSAFRKVCPGVQVSRPKRPVGGTDDRVLGPYVSIWAAWASDEDIRWHGSSGGVLTALSAYLLERGSAHGVTAAGVDSAAPTRPVTVRLTSRQDAIAAAGSRYAPVANLAGLDLADLPDVVVGKPCEVDAARRLAEISGHAREPLLLSFFCAGVPSQHATDLLATELGVPVPDVSALRYRGQGWPGDFVVTAVDGSQHRQPYEIAWGQRLGRDIQDRCKICPDGTGMHADIAVGDLWKSDARGYPVFDSADGVSVAIARTRRGHDLLVQSARDGALVLQPTDAAAVLGVQPSQVRRSTELPGRLAGRRAAGRAVPRYRRFRMIRTALARPRLMVRAARGTRSRTRRGRS